MTTLSRKSSSSTFSSGGSRGKSASRAEAKNGESRDSLKNSAGAEALQELSEAGQLGVSWKDAHNSKGLDARNGAWEKGENLSVATRALGGEPSSQSATSREDTSRETSSLGENAGAAKQSGDRSDEMAKSASSSASLDSSQSSSVQKALSESSSGSAGMNEQKSFDSSARGQESSSSGASMSSGQSTSGSRQSAQMAMQDCEQSSTTEKISIAAALNELGAENGSALLRGDTVSMGSHESNSVSRTGLEGITHTEEVRADRTTSYEKDGETGEVFKTLAQSSCAGYSQSMDESTASVEFFSEADGRMNEAQQNRLSSAREAADDEGTSQEAAAAEEEMDMAD